MESNKKVFICPKCGSEIEIIENQTIGHCDLCDSLVVLPSFLIKKDLINAEQHRNMINRINKAIEFGLSYQFHRAYNLYDKLIKNNYNLNIHDAFPYIGKFLSQYGVYYIMNESLELELVCNNILQESIYENENYQKALLYADGNSQVIIKKEANLIDQFQKDIRKELIKSEPLDVFIMSCDDERSIKITNLIKMQLEQLNLSHSLFIDNHKVPLKQDIIDISKNLSMAKHLILISPNEESLNNTTFRNIWMSYLNDKEILLDPTCHISLILENSDNIENSLIKDNMSVFNYNDTSKMVDKIVKFIAHYPNVVEYNVDYEFLWKHIENEEYQEVRDYLNQKLKKESINYEGWLLLFLSKHKIKNLDELDNLVINPLESYYFQRTYMYAKRLEKEQLYNHYLKCLKNIEDLSIENDEYEEEVKEKQRKLYKREIINLSLRLIPVIISTGLSFWTLSLTNIVQFIIMLFINLATYAFLVVKLIKVLSIGRIPSIIKQNHNEKEYLIQLKKMLDTSVSAKYLPSKNTKKLHLTSIMIMSLAVLFFGIYLAKEIIVKIQNPSINYYYVFDKAYVTGGERETVIIPQSISQKEVVGITSRALYHNNLVKILIIEEGVTSIESEAFQGCPNLEKVYVPSTIEKVINAPFKDCHKIKEFTYNGSKFKPTDFLGNDYQQKNDDIIYRSR